MIISFLSNSEEKGDINRKNGKLGLFYCVSTQKTHRQKTQGQKTHRQKTHRQKTHKDRIPTDKRPTTIFCFFYCVYHGWIILNFKKRKTETEDSKTAEFCGRRNAGADISDVCILARGMLLVLLVFQNKRLIQQREKLLNFREGCSNNV